MTKALIIILSFTIGIIFSNDIELKTSDGKIVILHDNGTWEYKIVEKLDISNIDVDCKYKKNEIDDFSGDKKLWTKAIKFGQTKLGHKTTFQLRANKSKDGNMIALAFDKFGDLGCMSQMRSNVKLKFSDGEMMELTHHSSTECRDGAEFMSIIYGDSEAMQELAMSEEDYEKLKTMKIEMIRIQGTEYYTDVTIDEDKQDYFIKYITCVE